MRLKVLAFAPLLPPLCSHARAFMQDQVLARSTCTGLSKGGSCPIDIR